MANPSDPALMDSPVPTALYEQMVRYLVAHGWRRQEAVSGWWWKDGMDEAVTSDAVFQQLDADGVDTRVMLDGEPQEFWG